jgi:hypothetical protein
MRLMCARSSVLHERFIARKWTQGCQSIGVLRQRTGRSGHVPRPRVDGPAGALSAMPCTSSSGHGLQASEHSGRRSRAPTAQQIWQSLLEEYVHRIGFFILCDPLVERGQWSSGRPQSYTLCNSVLHEGVSPSLLVQECKHIPQAGDWSSRA